jgi:hypothetical protein
VITDWFGVAAIAAAMAEAYPAVSRAPRIDCMIAPPPINVPNTMILADAATQKIRRPATFRSYRARGHAAAG